jgi:hypothetical protein
MELGSGARAGLYSEHEPWQEGGGGTDLNWEGESSAAWSGTRVGFCSGGAQTLFLGKGVPPIQGGRQRRVCLAAVSGGLGIPLVGRGIYSLVRPSRVSCTMG